jgi:hypothetical protein
VINANLSIQDISKDLALTPQGKSQTDYIDCVMAHFFNLEPQDKFRRLEEEKRLQANGVNGSFLSGYDESSEGAKGGSKLEYSDLLQSDNMNYEYEDDEEDDEDDDEKEFVPPKSVMKKAKTPRKSVEKDLNSSESGSSEDSEVINAKKRKYDEMKVSLGVKKMTRDTHCFDSWISYSSWHICSTYHAIVYRHQANMEILL